MTRLVPAVLGLVLLAPAEPANNDDWPQWLGPNRDAVWRETGIIDRIPDAGLPVKWRTTIAAGFSGPSVAGGRVYVTDFVKHSGTVTNRPSTAESVSGKERVLCLDAETGKLLWKHEYDVRYSVSYPSGPRVSPLISGDKVYTVGTDGDLLCLDAATGRPVWSKDFARDYGAKTPFWGHSSHPLIHGDTLICLVGGEGSTVVALDKDTGEDRWKALSAKEPGYAPATIATLLGSPTLIVWHPESLNALRPSDGKVLWSIDLPARSGMSVTAPLVSGNRIYVSGIGTRPALIEVGADGASPKIVWRGNARVGITAGNSSPLVHEGVLYGVDTQGRLIASSLATGERLWSTFRVTTGSQREAYSTAFLVRKGELFFVFNEKGDLVLAELSEDGYSERGRFHVLAPSTHTYGRDVVWSHPAFAQRCMFARNDHEIVCVSLAATSDK